MIQQDHNLNKNGLNYGNASKLIPALVTIETRHVLDLSKDYDSCVSTGFWVLHAPESWLKYTLVVEYTTITTLMIESTIYTVEGTKREKNPYK